MTKKSVKVSNAHQPSFYKNPRIFTFDFSSQDMAKCRPDWYRGIKTSIILSEGKPIANLFEKYPFQAERSETGDQNLQRIWQEITTDKMQLDADKAVKLLTHLGQYAHQYGYMHALKQSISQNLSKRNYVLDSNESPSVMDFMIKDNKLIIEERTRITKVRAVDAPFDETKIISSKQADKPLCEGVLRHEISFDKAGEIKHRIAKLELTANNPKIMKLLDVTSSKEKLLAFFKKMAGSDLERRFRPKV